MAFHACMAQIVAPYIHLEALNSIRSVLKLMLRSSEATDEYGGSKKNKRKVIVQGKEYMAPLWGETGISSPRCSPKTNPI
jgi:hypothetical protein